MQTLSQMVHFIISLVFFSVVASWLNLNKLSMSSCDDRHTISPCNSITNFLPACSSKGILNLEKLLVKRYVIEMQVKKFTYF